MVGSQCAELSQLTFIDHLPHRLDSALRQRGRWENPPGQVGPLLNPTVLELKAAVQGAFKAADQAGATLLLAFVGHGITTSAGRFRFLAVDSPADSPGLGNSFDVAAEISDRLENPGDIDGLVVLVDACESGDAVKAAAAQWPALLQSSGRLELLAASAGNAYMGCFTEAILSTFSTGLTKGGDNLRCADLVQPISMGCLRQAPQHLAYTVGAPSSPVGGDPGLWLVPNIARIDDAVAGRPSAGLVDQLTNHLALTSTLLGTLEKVLDADSARLRVLSGPAGCGKSTVMALLIRPSLTDALDITADYITAAVFLDATSTVETVTDELIQALDRLPGFTAARESVKREGARNATLTAFEIDIARPLARCQRAGKRVRLIFDGLDQPAPEVQDLLADSLVELSNDAGLEHVRVIVGVRAGSEPERLHADKSAQWVGVAAPIARELMAVLASDHDGSVLDLISAAVVARIGGWLVARLIREIDWTLVDLGSIDDGRAFDQIVRIRLGTTYARARASREVDALVGFLVAVGVGPSAPIRLIQKAFTTVGHKISMGRLRDLIADCGALLARGRPGRPDETVGLAHEAVSHALESSITARGIEMAAMHRALLNASNLTSDADIESYRRSAAPRHRLGATPRPPSVTEAATQSQDETDPRQRLSRWLRTMPKADPTARSEFIVAANVLPFTIERLDDGSLDQRRSFGGVVAVLNSVTKFRNAKWVGRHGSTGVDIPPLVANGTVLHSISLPPQIARDYDDFCKSTLWPLYHDGILHPVRNRSWWDAYVSANRRFAKELSTSAAEGATVWIHCHQLQLAPTMLRELRPDVVIGFFFHIPFPPVEVFMHLPWRTKIIRGLLGANLVGFQISSHASNFVDLAQRLIGPPIATQTIAEKKLTTIEFESQKVRVGAFPTSIPASEWMAASEHPSALSRAQQLREELGNPRKIILGIDPLEHTKGIEVRLAAIEDLLFTQETDMRGVAVVQFTSPGHDPRNDKQLALDLKRRIQRIKSNYDWVDGFSITYQNQALPSDELIAWLIAADVMCITSLTEGMNLIAKEYVACRSGLNGALVLSEFAGAATELPQAFFCNPYDLMTVQDAITEALHGDQNAATRRMRALRRRVLQNDSTRWAKSFLDTLVAEDPHIRE